MDTRTGEIMGRAELKRKMGKLFNQYAVPVDPQGLSTRRQKQLQQSGRTKIGPNEPCPCKSGKKFKKCCWRKG